MIPTAILQKVLCQAVLCLWSLAALGPLGMAALWANPAAAAVIDEVGLLAGDSKHADMTALVLTQNTDWAWFSSPSGRLQVYWQTDIAQWRGKGLGGRDIRGVGLAPVFRYTWSVQGPIRPYLEGAIGVHYFSGVRLSNAKRMGTRFEFGDHLGFGFAIGKKPGIDLAFRLQHFSNAGISDYNQGVDFQQIQLRVSF